MVGDKAYLFNEANLIPLEVGLITSLHDGRKRVSLKNDWIIVDESALFTRKKELLNAMLEMKTKLTDKVLDLNKQIDKFFSMKMKNEVKE